MQPETTLHDLRFAAPRHRLRRGVALALMFGFALSVPVTLKAAPLTMAFSGRSITIDGITPGGDAVLFAVVHELQRSSPPAPIRTDHAVLLHDTSRSGQVVFERSQPVPLVGVWVGVDVTTGHWVVSGSPGFQPQLVPPDEFVKRDNAGQLRKLSAQISEIYAIVIRPGTGGWHIYAAKTSSADESGRDEHVLRIDVHAMSPFADAQGKLNALLPGDVVAFIEPQSLQYTVTEVGK